MKADLFDVDKFVKVNNLKEVTNPILLERDNIPTTDGLLSYEIFGRTSQDRSTIFAYIDLHGHFLNPLVYKTWKRMNRKIEGIVSGINKVSINAKGDIVDDEENGWTGLEELYKHYDQIVFKEKDSSTQKERIEFMKALKKNEIFITKCLVCPPFYRDLQLNNSSDGKVSIHEKTNMYSNILRAAKALENDFSGLAIVNNSTRNRLQKLLVDNYTDMYMKDIKGKNGMFRRNVMGKSVDYGARLVISSPIFDPDKKDDMQVSYEYSSVPLACCCALFFPFFIRWIKNFFYNEVYMVKEKYPVFDKKTKEPKYIKIIDADKFNDDYITRKINLLIKSYDDRFETIPLTGDDNNEYLMHIRGREADISNLNSTESTIMSRPCTWTDILYLAAVDICKDKHAFITRYPYTGPASMVVTRINVASTLETNPMIVNGTLYKFYPKVDTTLTKSQVSILFRDTLGLSNSYLEGLGGDYDGDQVSLRGVWDINANKRCEQLMHSVKNFIDISGHFMRTNAEKEPMQTLFNMSHTSKEFID